MPVELTARKPQPADEPRRLTGRGVLAWVVGFFAVIFAANIALVWLALDSWTGLEVESSYKAGQHYEEEIVAAREQETRKWAVTAHAERSADGRAAISTTAADKDGEPLAGLEFTAHLSRPTARQLDRTVTLVETAPGRYEAVAADVRPGQWDLILIAGRDGKRLFRSRNRMVLN